MSLSKFNGDVNIIQTLDDEPNDVGGLTSAQLKAKFDEAAGLIKAYLNDVLTAEADTALSAKVPTTRTVSGHALSEDVTVSKADVGLGAADNTSDADKPLSVAMQEALSLKANSVDVLTKANVTEYTPTENYQPATKKYADEVAGGVVLGQIPDGSLTDAKLATDAVTATKLANDAKALFAAASHTHDASTDLTGRVPVANGGTGADTAEGARAGIGAAAVSHMHGNLSSDGKIGGVALDSTLVRLVGSGLQTLGGITSTAFQFLGSTVTGSNASQVNLYTSGSIWAQYHLILVEAVLPSGGAYMGVNGSGRSLTVSSINWDYNGVAQVGSGVPLRMLVPVCQNGAEIFRALSVGMSFYFGACDIAISSISYLSLKATDSNSTVPAGTTVKVWGVK